MARLEDLTPGARIQNPIPGSTVEVVQLTWHGTEAATLTYRDGDGRVGKQLVYRDDEARLEVEAPGAAGAFDGNGALFRLVSKALRIRLAYLFDALLAVHTWVLEALPDQMKAVYGELLPRQPLRFLLADDSGEGKTIMAGLYIKELIVRADLRRCLVICPGALVEQWQDELHDKFGMSFEFVTRETIENSRSADPFAQENLVIARLDHLARTTTS